MVDAARFAKHSGAPSGDSGVVVGGYQRWKHTDNPPDMGAIKKVADNSRIFSQVVVTTLFAETENWYKKCYKIIFKAWGRSEG